MKMDHSECPEMSAYKFQTPGNCPEESVQHSEHGESLKSRNLDSLIYKLLYIKSKTAVSVLKADGSDRNLVLF